MGWNYCLGQIHTGDKEPTNEDCPSAVMHRECDQTDSCQKRRKLVSWVKKVKGLSKNTEKPQRQTVGLLPQVSWCLVIQ